MTWDLPATVSAATDRTAAYFNKYKSCFDELELHTHDNSDGDGATLANLYQRRDDALLMPLAPLTGGNFAFSSAIAGALGSVYDGSPAQNHYGEWLVRLARGAYTVKVGHHKRTDSGIATFQLDGATFGTVDGYTTPDTADQVATIEGLSVPADGLHTIKMLMATKNASSSNYGFRLSFLFFLRSDG